MCFLKELLSWAHWIQINLTFVAIRRRLETRAREAAIYSEGNFNFTQRGHLQSSLETRSTGALVIDQFKKYHYYEILMSFYTALRSHRSEGPVLNATSMKTSFALFQWLVCLKIKTSIENLYRRKNPCHGIILDLWLIMQLGKIAA